MTKINTFTLAETRETKDILKHITIRSKLKDYDVVFLSSLEELIDSVSCVEDAVFIVDLNVLKHYPAIEAFIKKKDAPLFAMEAIEINKSLDQTVEFLNFMQINEVKKSTTVIALGGGIVQEISTFAAHTYLRGIKLVFVPTTLLSMCDSCIGGKCAINFNAFKNQIGFFHSPEVVYIWIGFTKTLLTGDIYSGVGEIFKLALIGGRDQYDNFLCHFEDGITENFLFSAIYSSLLVKKSYIEKDEFDTNERHILNYGHTFGHAIETITRYAIPHGCAVILGIDIANYIAVELGVLSKSLYLQLNEYIWNNLVKFEVRNYFNRILLSDVVRKDKKSNGVAISMVLFKSFAEFSKISVDIKKDLLIFLSGYEAEVLSQKKGMLI